MDIDSPDYARTHGPIQMDQSSEAMPRLLFIVKFEVRTTEAVTYISCYPLLHVITVDKQLYELRATIPKLLSNRVQTIPV